ncbi:MAG TPA: NAD-dependent epimerase/dehydratase family protein [Polyangiales bacterium]|nr:NAD-dependent epimerase/dehydratase family protein [Polyangiales bacterium]
MRTLAGRGRSIAISGATTYLGRQLVAHWASVDSITRIVVVDVANPDSAGAKTCFYAMDLTQPGVDARLSEVLEAEGVDTFVHLAQLESPIHATAWAHEYERSGTLQVLRACHKQHVSKLVVASTALVYGPHRDNPNFLREDRPLRGLHGSPFVADKLDIETQVAQWRQAHPDSVVTVLRMALTIGRNVDNFATQFLSRTIAATVLGFDPLVQFTHELDAVAALELAVERDVSGVFNIASEGVLRLSSAIRLAGHLPLPLPYALLRRAAGLLWMAKLCEAPSQFVALLRHLCVIDTARAESELGFRPRFTSRDAVFELRSEAPAHDAKLLSEAR